jgi:2-keto-4-pentenoate hydratase/2-oxohepta-3-ene-1,7-dioic acid hydratase in catechol pathway
MEEALPLYPQEFLFWIGQTLPAGETTPAFGPSRLIDFELETAFITTDANVMGEMIPINEVEEYIFGMVLLNDWSARYQKWEYVPLGTFLNFCFIYITLDCYYGCFRTIQSSKS